VSESKHSPTGGPGDVLDGAIHLSGGFGEADRPRVLDALSALGAHLSRWDPDGMRLEVSVKDRDGKEQTVTLRAELPGYPTLVAKGANRHLGSALAAARRELIRQLEDEKKKREPQKNRHLRRKTS
jgi:ribosome-associated translation inhibitor RaiA